MNDETLSKLERLAKLKEQGAITDSEFEQQKAQILSGGVSPPAPIPTPSPTEKEKDKKALNKGCLGWVGLLFFLLILGAIFNKTKENQSSTDGESSTATETPTPKTRDEIVKGFFSYYDGSHRGLEKAIKKNLNDPDSYEHDETRFRDDGATIYVITKYRAKNAFNGTVVNYAEATLNGSTGELIEWKDKK